MSGTRLLRGTMIAGRYRVVGVLGEGGMGTVYEAEQIEVRRRVAIKVLHAARVQKKNAIQRFEREARLAASLGLPEVVEVYDVGSLPTGEPYFVMERLVGRTLRERMQEELQLPVGVAISIMSQVLAVLAVAHSRGVIHRDIKPENIFLMTVPNHEPARVKLIDFGVAKFLTPTTLPATDVDEPPLTATGIVVGTPWYVSPEQARGAKSVDGRADLWACTVILYEMVTGRRPFDSRDTPAASALRPGISWEFDAIIDRGLEKNPDSRYQSAAEFRETLHAFWDFNAITLTDKFQLERVARLEDAAKTMEANVGSLEIPIYVASDKTVSDEWTAENEDD